MMPDIPEIKNFTMEQKWNKKWIGKSLNANSFQSKQKNYWKGMICRILLIRFDLLLKKVLERD